MSFTASIDEVVEENRNKLLGKHPSWNRVRLQEVATILNGFPFESARFKKTQGMPLIRIRDVVRGRTETFYDGDFDPAFLVQPGELLVGMDGDFHCEPWSGEPGLLNQRVCKITPDESRYAKQFLRYVLPGYLSAINEQTPSVTVKHLSSRTVADIPLPLPPLPVQHRIVTEIEKQFTRLEAGIGALKRVQANLKRYRTAVLQAACEGRLVPTEAELKKSPANRERSLSFETGTQLLQRILSDRRENWSGRGEYRTPLPADTKNGTPLPEGWTRATVDQIGEVGTGATPKRTNPAYYEGGTIPWVTSSALNKSFVNRASEMVTERALAETNLTIFPPGTLLVAMYGEGKTRGKCAELRIAATTNQAIAAIQAADEVRDFLKLSLWRQYEELRLSASGGVQPNLNLGLIRAINIPLPPLAEQKRIVAEVERRLSVIEELEAVVSANLQRSTRLRQSTLQHAFSGNL